MKKISIVLITTALLMSLIQSADTANAQEISAQAIPVNIKFESIATGLDNPLFVTNADDSSNRLFIVQNNGKILIYKNGSLNATPFLNMEGLILSGGERGLLGLAFDPDYETSGIFYVYYNNLAGDIEIARYTVSSGDADLADDTSREVIITIIKPNFSNHNGGSLAFGPDGYLYAAIGDGGSGGDPFENGQNLNSLLGKILRLDISGDDFPDAGKNYAIPPTNSFVGVAGSDEIWAYGVRNPWRVSFDKDTGDLYIADVGQNSREEVNFQPAASAGGENYGWNVMEGSLCYEPSSGCDASGKVLPVAEYDHNIGCSITGGYVYRGALFPNLVGVYLYSDFCGGQLFGLKKNGNDPWENIYIRATPYNASSFGEGEDGELYLTDYSSGSVFHIVEAPILTSTHKSQATNDGFIKEASETSNTGGTLNNSAALLRIGDQRSNKQIVSIVSFDTQSLSSTVNITSATIRLYGHSLAGNPFLSLGALVADIRHGRFGSSSTLQLSDFQAAASANKSATLINTAPLDNWYALKVSPSKFVNIKRNGLTQFRIKFSKGDDDNKIADFLNVYSGNASDPAFVPQLVIEYYEP